MYLPGTVGSSRNPLGTRDIATSLDAISGPSPGGIESNSAGGLAVWNRACSGHSNGGLSSRPGERRQDSSGAGLGSGLSGVRRIHREPDEGRFRSTSTGMFGRGDRCRVILPGSGMNVHSAGL